jgi:predicted nucleotide-binding protein (sugar kinase/HSP70/actin superfamily)
MDALARMAHQYYDNHLRGGEGHMEVGKVIQSVLERKHHMIVSVKPFGCMPSSGVSDGIQSVVTEQYPDAIFCPIETTGDGAANLQSRVMMSLFKARQRALDEFETILARTHTDTQQLRTRRNWLDVFTDPLRYPAQRAVAGTAASLIAERLRVRAPGPSTAQPTLSR